MNDNSNTSSKPKVSSSCKRNARVSRRRKLELGRTKDVVAGGEDDNNGLKRRKLQMFEGGKGESGVENGELSQKGETTMMEEKYTASSDRCPKFGFSSICGRRRDMEDFVAIHPSFCSKEKGDASEFHYFAVYDGHGCSHVC